MVGKPKHGDALKHIYKTWQSMRYRCQNPNHSSYDYYGAKGIYVCDEWNKDYVCFREWAYENGYSPELTIDRIDGSKGYHPSNCRWVDYQTQNTNLGMLSTNTSGVKGVSWNKRQEKWRCNISINNKTVTIGEYLNIKEAIIARNEYIDRYNLPHQKNPVPEE